MTGPDTISHGLSYQIVKDVGSLADSLLTTLRTIRASIDVRAQGDIIMLLLVDIASF
jgi:hypothetical protein